MSKDPCTGDDADLSNPACVVRSNETYQTNDSRWFCIGHLEAKDWSCASSLEEAQLKHTAMSELLAQLAQQSAVITPSTEAVDQQVEPKSQMVTQASTTAEAIIASMPAIGEAHNTPLVALADARITNVTLNQDLTIAPVADLLAVVDSVEDPESNPVIKQTINDSIDNGLKTNIPAGALESKSEALLAAIAPTRPDALTDPRLAFAQVQAAQPNLQNDLAGLSTEGPGAVPGPVSAAEMTEAPVNLVEPKAILSTTQAQQSSVAFDAETTEVVLVIAEDAVSPAMADVIEAPKVLSVAQIESPTVETEIARAEDVASPSVAEIPSVEIAAETVEAVVVLSEDVTSPALVKALEAPVAAVVDVTSSVVNKGVEAPINVVEVKAVLAIAQIQKPLIDIEAETAEVVTRVTEDAVSPAIADVIEAPKVLRVTQIESPTVETEPAPVEDVVSPAVAKMPLIEVEAETAEVVTVVTEDPVSSAIADVIEAPKVLSVAKTENSIVGNEIARIEDSISPAFVKAFKAPVAALVELARSDVIARVEAPINVVESKAVLTIAEIEKPSNEIETKVVEVMAGLTQDVVSPEIIDVLETPKVLRVAPLDNPTVTVLQAEKIASEIVVAAPAPFPAGTTLAEVYTEHVQRSEKLPAQLQTLGPNGMRPETAVGSTRSGRGYDVQPTQLQPTRPIAGSTTNRVAQTSGLTPAKPFIAAVANVATLDSISVAPSSLDYASMERPATSGDGTFDYFMDLPSDDFAIQLKAENNLAALHTFALTVDLQDPLVLKTQLMKRPLYVLVLDTFNDIQLASDAKRAWMAQYENGIEPWIRTVGSLQKTMQPIGPMD